MAVLILILILLAISLGVFALFVAMATIVVKKVWFSNRQRYQSRTHTYNYTPEVNHQRNTYSTESTKAEPKDGEISPTGWVYNENTKLWELPKQATKTNIRLKRTGPTYEEWKAAKQKEKKENPRD